MRRGLAVLLLLAVLACAAAPAEERVTSLTYAVYPYLPDSGYYQDLIEARWAALEPDIPLVRARWDCYTDGPPEGIDVIMYDAVMLNQLVAAGWIRPMDPGDLRDAGDLFPFALEALTRDGALYGVPVFLCGNFLIYDEDWDALAEAEHITDLADLSGVLVVNAGEPSNRRQYRIEAIADATGEANPTDLSGGEDILGLIDRLAVDAHEEDQDSQVALAYDTGVGGGYIGYSESMRLLKHRGATSRIKAISFSDRPNLPRLYLDAAAVTPGVEGLRYEKCLALIRVMAGAEVLTALSVREGEPQYLLPARRAPYRVLSGQFPLYALLEELAGNENNRVILTP